MKQPVGGSAPACARPAKDNASETDYLRAKCSGHTALWLPSAHLCSGCRELVEVRITHHGHLPTIIAPFMMQMQDDPTGGTMEGNGW